MGTVWNDSKSGTILTGPATGAASCGAAVSRVPQYTSRSTQDTFYAMGTAARVLRRYKFEGTVDAVHEPQYTRHRKYLVYCGSQI